MSQRKQSPLLYILLSVMCCVLVSVTLSAGVMWLGEGLYVPENAPLAIKYKRIDGARMVGLPKIEVHNRVSETTCMEKCDENHSCMAAVHKPDERLCNLFGINATVNPELFDDEYPKSNYFEKRYFWSRFGPEYQGRMEDIAGANASFDNVENKKECAIQCLNSNDPICTGFNYDSGTQKCRFLITPFKGYEEYLDESGSGIYHEVLPAPIIQEEDADSPEKETESLDQDIESTEKDTEPGEIETDVTEEAAEESFVDFQIRINPLKRFLTIMLILLLALVVFKHFM